MPQDRILICDDDPLLIDLISFRLEAKGYEVLKAADGDAALTRATEELPELIVLDAMMPRMDGFEVLLRIKNDPATAQIPVIMLTARRSERDIVSALERGADDYLVKPFIPDELLARIFKLLVKARRVA